jgi:hypothetical protein
MEEKYFLAVLVVFGALMLFGCIQKQTVEICSAMPAGNDKNQCFRAVAKAQNDTSICASIDDDVLKNYWCYREIAYDTKNPSLCELITDKDAKDSCYGILNGSRRFERGVRI